MSYFLINLCMFLAQNLSKDYNNNKKKRVGNRKMNMMLILDIVITVVGIYMVAAGLKMKKTGEISSLILAEEELKKCKDKKGFISYIYWKEALLGGVMTAVGLLGLVNELLKALGNFKYVELVIFLAVFFWFSRELGAAREKYLSKF